MQTINLRSDLFTNSNIKCFQVNKFSTNDSQKNFTNTVYDVQKTLDSLQQNLDKTNKYEQRLAMCKKRHNHSRDSHKWWDSEPSEQKSYKYSNTNGSTSPPKDGVNPAESLSTTGIVCLQYQFQELSRRYDSLLQAYDDKCSELTVRDMRVAEWRQRASLIHAQLACAHKALLAVGDKYLAVRRKRHTLKSQCDERVKRLKNILHDVVEITTREQLRFDAKLSYCMVTERNSDAALLLYEMRKCNRLFLENMQLKTIIEELLPGHVNWNTC